MFNAATKVTIFAAAALTCATAAYAQTSPTPGPTNPTPPQSNPLSKPGTDLVINPTVEECQKGWTPGVKWTKEQFDAFCQQMRTSK